MEPGPTSSDRAATKINCTFSLRSVLCSTNNSAETLYQEIRTYGFGLSSQYSNSVGHSRHRTYLLNQLERDWFRHICCSVSVSNSITIKLIFYTAEAINRLYTNSTKQCSSSEANSRLTGQRSPKLYETRRLIAMFTAANILSQLSPFFGLILCICNVFCYPTM